MLNSLKDLSREVLIDLSAWCDGTNTSRDIQTVAARIDTEGLPFLMVTLPRFGKELEGALDRGYVSPDDFVGWKKISSEPTAIGHGRRLPVFLQTFMRRVFDAKTGHLLDEPDIRAIWCLRQFTLMWAKIKHECSEPDTAKAMKDYVRIEEEFDKADYVFLVRRRVEDVTRPLGQSRWVQLRLFHGSYRVQLLLPITLPESLCSSGQTSSHRLKIACMRMVLSRSMALEPLWTDSLETVSSV